jgi:pyruvate/2-oxoglutarate dehydrogenase complex dihydrolipoamide acyltransferase (E2) component
MPNTFETAGKRGFRIVRDELIGRFEVQPYPLSRTAGIDTVAMGKLKHHIPVLLEVDVTAARTAIQRQKEDTGQAPSFTGWVVSCLAKALSEHKRVHAMRQGRRKLVLFDDVDITVVVNREVADGDSNYALPIPCLIRRANQKRLDELNTEIRAAQSRPLAPGEQVLDDQGQATSPRQMRLFLRLPWILRRWLVWNRLVKDPMYAKRMMGTVVVSSVGMYGGIGGGDTWVIPATMVPLSVALGGIARKPGYFERTLQPREILSMTILFDHDVIDGAHVFVFVERLRGLMESAFSL